MLDERELADAVGGLIEAAIQREEEIELRDAQVTSLNSENAGCRVTLLDGSQFDIVVTQIAEGQE